MHFPVKMDAQKNLLLTIRAEQKSILIFPERLLERSRNYLLVYVQFFLSPKNHFPTV